MHIEQWSDPPGSTWITYARKSDAFVPKPRDRQPRETIVSACTVARYALDVPWGRRPLPLVTETLPLAEAVRFTLMKIHRGEARAAGGEGPGEEPGFSRTFSGKDGARTPLRGHGHAYFLPADEDGDGRIDHVTVIAGAGFTQDEIRALDR